MRHRRARSGGHRDRGAAAVELAIVLPLVLVIIGGIIDFGRFFFTKIELTNAAREGVRAAMVPVATPGPLPTSRALAALPGITPPIVTVSVQQCISGSSSPTNARALVAMPTFKWILLQPALNMVGGPATLPTFVNATAVMKCGG
jgi:Flp pilus assembly protein TadG